MNAIFLGRQAGSTSASKVIAQQFDACASWWTQGPDTTLQVIDCCKISIGLCFEFLLGLHIDHNMNLVEVNMLIFSTVVVY